MKLTTSKVFGSKVNDSVKEPICRASQDADVLAVHGRPGDNNFFKRFFEEIQ